MQSEIRCREETDSAPLLAQSATKKSTSVIVPVVIKPCHSLLLRSAAGRAMCFWVNTTSIEAQTKQNTGCPRGGVFSARREFWNAGFPGKLQWETRCVQYCSGRRGRAFVGGLGVARSMTQHAEVLSSTHRSTCMQHRADPEIPEKHCHRAVQQTAKKASDQRKNKNFASSWLFPTSSSNFIVCLANTMVYLVQMAIDCIKIWPLKIKKVMLT